MPRKSPPLQIAEIGGNQYPDIETVQQLALPTLANGLVSTLRDLLAEGILTLKDGRIVCTVPPAKGEKTSVK
jgi:hypothetical protein